MKSGLGGIRGTGLQIPFVIIINFIVIYIKIPFFAGRVNHMNNLLNISM